MAFTLQRLLGTIDLFTPTWDEIVTCVEQGAGFALEGDDEGNPGTCYVAISESAFVVETEALDDRDQHVLTDSAKGDSLIQFISAGDEYRYPAFCLVSHDLLMRALRYFVQSGQRDPTLGWMPISELLEKYEMFPE